MDFIQDNFGTPWLFVGAPKDYDSNLQNKSGTVNACPLNDLRGDLKCSVRFPQLQNANENEIFDDQLLGVTVTTAEQVSKPNFFSNFANTTTYCNYFFLNFILQKCILVESFILS